MFKKFKEFSFLAFFIFLAALMIAVHTVETYSPKWNLSIFADRIALTGKWFISLPFSIPYEWNFLLAFILSVALFFILPKRFLFKDPGEQSGASGAYFVIFLLSLVISMFHVLAGFIVFFILFHIVLAAITMGLIETEKDVENLDGGILHNDVKIPEHLLKFNYKLSEQALSRNALAFFLVFCFSLCLLKGAATGIFFALAFIVLSFVFGAIMNRLSEGDEKKQKKISVVIEN